VGDSDSSRDPLIQAGLVLASELSLPAVLQKLVKLACDVADARYGALGVLGSEGVISEFITHGVTDEERRAIGHIPVGRGILGALITEARPLRLRRIQDDERSVGFPANHPQMTSFLGVPIKIHDRVYGNLYLTEKRGAPEFTAHDEAAVITLATQAAVAIENARIRGELRRLAVLEDRERIAKELHDGVIQSLFAVGMSLQAAEGTLDDPEALRERLQAAVEDIDRAIRELRNYIFGLGPGGPADRHLDLALRDLVEEFRRGSDVAMRVDIDPEAASLLTSNTADILQLVREAMANSVRHAGAETLALELRREDGEIVVEVEDDGSGFDPEDVSGGGRGLANLRDRAEAIGGRLEISSSRGRGTRVRLSIPA
jgi:signal transduction histidine kinase